MSKQYTKSKAKSKKGKHSKKVKVDVDEILEDDEEDDFQRDPYSQNKGPSPNLETVKETEDEDGTTPSTFMPQKKLDFMKKFKGKVVQKANRFKRMSTNKPSQPGFNPYANTELNDSK